MSKLSETRTEELLNEVDNYADILYSRIDIEMSKIATNLVKEYGCSREQVLVLLRDSLIQLI